MLIIEVVQAEECNEVLLHLLNRIGEKVDLFCFDATTVLDHSHCNNLLVGVQDDQGETSQDSNLQREDQRNCFMCLHPCYHRVVQIKSVLRSVCERENFLKLCRAVKFFEGI